MTPSLSKFTITPKLNVNPADFRIAFVSIDMNGTPGRLNQYVLEKLGYSGSDIPNAKQLEKGYHVLARNRAELPIIIFVVTVGKSPTASLLEKNLSEALKGSSHLINDQLLWIPLMGTGSGGLRLKESYDITTQVLNASSEQMGFSGEAIIAIPNSDEGTSLFYALDSEKPEVEGLVKSFRGSFHAVGSTWQENQDKTIEFLSANVWQNGYDDRFIEEIRAIKVDDILVLKSTFARGKQAQFRVKALGRVIENDGSGKWLRVDWIIRTGNVDISGKLASKRNTIQRLSQNEMGLIFDQLSPTQEELKNLFNSSEKAKSANLYTSLNNDSALGGDDLLGFEDDINALASIIALEEMEPPLAIGLFGNWGSGKSFFMHKLQRRVEQLSNEYSEVAQSENDPNEERLFCNGIAQIHFNAWSYLDSNLWASLVTRIFEGLNEFIKGEIEAEKFEKETKKELTSQLELANEQKRIIQRKKRELETQIDKLEKKKKDAQEQIENKLAEIRGHTRDAIVSRVCLDLDVEQKLKNALSQIKLGPGDLDRIEPDKTLEELRSIRTFTLQFLSLSVKDFKWILLMVVFIIVQIIGHNWSDSFFALIKIPKSLAYLIPGLIAGIGKTHRAINTLSPVYKEVLKIRDDYENQVQRAISKIEQEEKALIVEIDQSKEERLNYQNQLNSLEEDKAELEYALDHTLAQTALYSFISHMNDNDQYKEHLGLISIIRKDFETLSNLFYSTQKELKNSTIPDDKLAEYKKILKQIETDKGRPLDRIVLYIDDLDRCPEERVVEVLEAIHLLMSFPLFVVVVGVDPRWIKNALIKKYYTQFEGRITDRNHSTVLNEYQLEKIDASDYLEKIFQVPFKLKTATEAGISKMIENLLETSVEDANDLEENENPVPDSKSEPRRFDEGKGFDRGISFDSSSNTGEPLPDRIIPSAISRESLKLTSAELDDLKALLPLLVNTPRSIKRIINVYRIMRAHEIISRDRLNRQDSQLIIFLLALPVGNYKSIAADLCKVLTSAGAGFSLLNFLKAETNNELHQQLAEKLEKQSILSELVKPISRDMQEYVSFVNRFTFSWE
jgi:hypothetical protein